MAARRTLSRDEVRAVYDRTGRWQDTQAFYEAPAIDALIAHGNFESAASLFEIGCGTGRVAERILRTQCFPDARYVGVDLSSTMVDLARERLSACPHPTEVVHTDGGFDFAPSAGTQDRVLATYVLDLLSDDDRRALLREAHRLLAPSGRLCLAGLTMGPGGISRLLSSLWSALHAVRPEWVGGCRPIRMRGLLDSTRWAVVHHETVRAWGVPSEVLIAAPR